MVRYTVPQLRPRAGATRTQQPRPQLKLRPWQSSCVRIRSALRRPLSSPGTGALTATRPPHWPALLPCVGQRPCGCPLRACATSAVQQLQAPRRPTPLNSVSQSCCLLSAGAEQATQQRAACSTARRPRVCLVRQACSRSALPTALPSLTTLLAMAGLQVGARCLAALQCHWTSDRANAKPAPGCRCCSVFV